MEPESLANGSQEEKNVLKPTKSILSSGEPTIIENGNDDNEISKNTENGHSEEGTNENTVCTNTEKENSVKNEPFPSKRDLRPRESTPRSTPVKEKAPKAGTPKRETKVKASNKTPDEKPIDSITEEKPDTTVENSDTTVENSDTNVEKSEKMIESPEAKLDNLNDLRETCLESNEELSEENVVVDVITEEQKQYSAVGFFSSFLSPKKSANPENIGEVATSQCVLNIESPSLAETYDMKTDIQSRRAIKAFSRFPGRNVSLSPSLKRKGEDDPIHHDEKKKCTRESGSEKSPGKFSIKICIYKNKQHPISSRCKHRSDRLLKDLHFIPLFLIVFIGYL